MILYILQKLGYALLTLFGVVTIVFFLFTILPGDPARMMLGQNETAEQVDIVKKKYGFDRPIYLQYLSYLNDLSPISFHSTKSEDYSFLAKGKYNSVDLISFGGTQMVLKTPYLRESFQKNGKEVSSVIAETLPNTFVLAVSAIFIAMFIGVMLGIISVVFRDGFIDKSIQLISTLGMSVPSFFSAIIFAWIFGFMLHQYTNLNMTGSLYEVDDFGAGKYLQVKNLILPAIVLD